MHPHPNQLPSSQFQPLTKEDVADILGVTVRCIENWVEEGVIPAWRKIGTRCFWHPDLFFGWLADYLKSDSPELIEAPPKLPKAPRFKRVESAGGVHALNAGRLAKIAAGAAGQPRDGSA